MTIYGNNDAAVALGIPVGGPGQSVTENITFNIQGVNDDPFFRAAPVSISESPWVGGGISRADNIAFGDFDSSDTHFAFARFNATDSSVEGEIGHLTAYVEDDTTGGTNVNGVIHWTYDAGVGFGTTPIHQVYDIVLQDNHGGIVVQPFTIDLFPHI